jgi:hypothetical protein
MRSLVDLGRKEPTRPPPLTPRSLEALGRVGMTPEDLVPPDPADLCPPGTPDHGAHCFFFFFFFFRLVNNEKKKISLCPVFFLNFF